jgi:hypothetical protein
MATEHGTRSAYKAGCLCDECKAANAEYMRERRAAQKLPAGTVTQLPGTVQTVGAGATECAVLEELATLTSAETRKGAAQAALAMARILDNPKAIAQQPQAAARLTTILEDLRKGSARRKGRLASVQAMTKTGT